MRKKPAKPNRKRPSRMVTIDPDQAKRVLVKARRQKPPIPNLSRLIDAALAYWDKHHR